MLALVCMAGMLYGTAQLLRHWGEKDLVTAKSKFTVDLDIDGKPYSVDVEAADEKQAIEFVSQKFGSKVGVGQLIQRAKDTNKIALLLEAEKRGILPPEKRALLNEARKRGMLPGEGKKVMGKIPPPPDDPSQLEASTLSETEELELLELERENEIAHRKMASRGRSRIQAALALESIALFGPPLIYAIYWILRFIFWAIKTLRAEHALKKA